MKIVNMMVLLGAVLGSQLVYGETFKKFMSKNSLSQGKKIAADMQFPHCTNFSGTWEGECTDEDGTIDKETLVIEQDDCTGLLLDEDYLVMGVNRRGHSRFNGENFDFGLTLNWNRSRTVINAIFIGYGAAESSHMRINGKIDFELLDEKLKSTYESEYTFSYGGTERNDATKTICIYNKKT